MAKSACLQDANIFFPSKKLNLNILAQFNPTNTVGVRTRFRDDWFTLEQIHFHWGPSDSEGSEHTENGTAYPLEMHMVNLNDGKTEALALGVSLSDQL